MGTCLTEKEIDDLAHAADSAENERHMRRCAGCRERLKLARRNLELLRELQELDATRERIRGLIAELPEIRPVE